MSGHNIYQAYRDLTGKCRACGQPAYLGEHGVCGPCFADMAEYGNRKIKPDACHIQAADACDNYPFKELRHGVKTLQEYDIEMSIDADMEARRHGI